VLIAISIGYRVVEAQRKKHVEGVLATVSGQPVETGPSILVDRNAADPIEDLLKHIDLARRINELLQQAGLPWSALRFLMLPTLFGAAGFFLGALFRPVANLPLSATVFMVLFAMFPWVYVRFKRSSRLFEMEAQLPEALDFLARSMRAGHAFTI